MVEQVARRHVRRQVVGRLILVLSGMGYPLTQFAIVRHGRRGAVVAQGIAALLLVRDATLVATGAPALLRAGPARLLYLEGFAALVAALAGLRLLTGDPTIGAVVRPGDRLEWLRRVSMAALFGLHTWRFSIYLQPDHGRRTDLVETTKAR